MKIPVSWIKEYIEYNVSNEKIAELLTMSGTEVSDIIKFGNEWDSNIIIGEIKKINKHPNADRLSLVDVDNSQNIVKVVCGAPNIQVGQKIALAQPGTKLYNPYEKKISVLKKSKIRGVESNGMICSALELNYYDDHEGIIVLDPNLPYLVSLNLDNLLTPVGKAISDKLTDFIPFLKSNIILSIKSLSLLLNISFNTDVINSRNALGKLLLTISKPLTSNLSHSTPASFIIH